MAYQYDTSNDSPNFTASGDAPQIFGYNRTIEGITIHYWGDNNPTYEGVVSYLCRQGGNTSAHYIATGDGRRVACIVAPMDVAWATGSKYGNTKTISIECDPRMRDEDYDVIAEVIADIRSAFGDVPLYRHDMWTETKCPSHYDIDRLDKMSYTKQSNDAWGAVTNKVVTPVPAPAASQPAPAAPVAALLYKVIKDDKQIGAYAKDINAWNALVASGAQSITAGGTDITADLRTKFTATSPTAGQPDSGVPVSEKLNYTELEKRITNLEAIVNMILDFFKKLGNK